MTLQRDKENTGKKKNMVEAIKDTRKELVGHRALFKNLRDLHTETLDGENKKCMWIHFSHPTQFPWKRVSVDYRSPCLSTTWTAYYARHGSEIPDLYQAWHGRICSFG